MEIRNQPESMHFDINAAVVFRLGEELITDDVQALVELVKNSYDADATWVKISIDTHAHGTGSVRFPDASGNICVEDNGDGMDGNTIRDGWLTIANSPKRDNKAAGRVTRRGRTPIGDKGLGRLGVQRLASNVEITTRPYAEKVTDEYYVAFSWKDFRDTASLSKVPLTYDMRNSTRAKSGTTLILSDLRDPHVWQSNDNLDDLQKKLSGMISPFQSVQDFVVHLEVDGKRLELSEIAQRVRETALLKYTLGFDGETFSMKGIVKFDYLQPSKKEDRQLLRSLFRRDAGRTLYEFLAGKAGKRRPRHFAYSEQAGWFVEFSEERSIHDMDRVRRVDGVIANPGVFRGEVDAVSLDRSDKKNHSFDRMSDYRRLVKDLAGIKVYRDGFGIRVGEDWLGLGKQWTEGTSYYGLRPANVLGYIAITAKDNPDLSETTSREGFQVTPYYENFYGLLSEFIRFTGNVQEFLRRGVLQYLNQYRDQESNVKPNDEHSMITQRIDEVASSLSAQKRKVQHYSGSLQISADRASKTMGQVRKDYDESLFRDRAVADALRRLEEALKEITVKAYNAEKILEEVSTELDRASELKLLREALDRRWETLHDEVSALYESISLGLTAEALTHEIHNIADGLTRRSASLLTDIKKTGFRKPSAIAYIEHVRNSVNSMRKQLSHLTPSLRYLREKRECIEIQSFLMNLAAFYSERLNEKNIELKIKMSEKSMTSSFAVYMNKGKLTQVLDNLIINSEYWLVETIRAGLIGKGLITIEVDKPVLRITDNGKGVEEGVEESIFEPFVTTKRGSRGRGLGLYVVQQLLDSESCGILLLPDRNARGRRYIFELDLLGVLHE